MTTIVGNPATGVLVAVEPLLLALDDLAAEDMAFDVGPRLTCGELDTLVAVFALSGHEDAAIAWVKGHSIEEEEGDSHYDVCLLMASDINGTGANDVARAHVRRVTG